ncbi:ABC transporter ATP-binding protein [Mycoplasmatota bacterium WC44]
MGEQLIKHFLNKFKFSMLVDILGRLLEVSVAYILVDVSGILVDDLVNNDLNEVTYYLGKFVLLSVISIILVPVTDFLVNKVLVNVGMKFDIYVYDLYLKQKYEVIDKYSKGDIFNRLYTDAIAYRLDLFTLITAVIGHSIIVIFMLFRLMNVNFYLTLILFAVTLIVVLVPAFTNKLTHKYVETDKEKTATKNNFEKQLIEHKEYIRINNYQGNLFNKLAIYIKDKLSIYRKFITLDIYKNNVTDLIVFSTQIVFMLIGSIFIANNEVTTGQFVLFFGGGFILKKSIEAIMWQVEKRLPRFKAINKRIVEILEHKEETDLEDTECINDIEFKDINFGYDDNVVLNVFNTKINKGDIVKIEGENGTGKTTIIKLLLKFYDVNEGNVLINGRDISTINAKSIRDKISYASQNPVLFNISVNDNIKLNTTVNVDGIIDLLDLNDIKDVVVDEASKNISGGQRKKISLARELIREKEIIVIDELRNYLDVKTYSNILKYLQNCNKTVILISHGDEELDFNNYIKL